MSKAKGKKAGKKAGAGDNDEEKDQLRSLIARNTVRIEALERELCFFNYFYFKLIHLRFLVIRKEQTRQAVRAKNEVESRSEEFAELISTEKADRSDIVASMTRQYKDMQDFLIAKNNELQQKIHKLEDQNGIFITIFILSTDEFSSP